MSAYMKIDGADRAERKLQAMGTTTGRKFVKKALRETTKATILPAAKESAKNKVGGDMGKLIAKFIKIRAFKKPQSGNALDVVWISPKGNDDFVEITKEGMRKYIPFAIEFGHGNVKANPFFRSAWYSSYKKAQKMLGQKILDGLFKVVRATK